MVLFFFLCSTHPSRLSSFKCCRVWAKRLGLQWQESDFKVEAPTLVAAYWLSLSNRIAPSLSPETIPIPFVYFLVRKIDYCKNVIINLVKRASL